jgi:hypothetical protein
MGLRMYSINILCALRWWRSEEVVIWCSLCAVFRVLHCITYKHHLYLSLIFGGIFTFLVQVPTGVVLWLICVL